MRSHITGVDVDIDGAVAPMSVIRGHVGEFSRTSERFAFLREYLSTKVEESTFGLRGYV
jgi:hypothetical protein